MSPKIQVDCLANVSYQHPDIAKAHQFLCDFGLKEVHRSENPTRIYYRGFGSQPYLYKAEQSPDASRHFLGATWLVKSRAELDIAAALPTAITSVVGHDGPGGGETVTVTDPLGFPVHFIHGQTLLPALPHSHDQRPTNFADEKKRFGVFQRFRQGPSEVHKLGHYGHAVPQDRLAEMVKFYTSIMNLAVSDAVYDPQSGADETVFFHIDKGLEWSDHHSIFFAGDHGIKPVIHHSSFEVLNLDTQLLGHDWLRDRGWKNCWGVGRHVLGSQIFDYWFDASGNVLEHYSDGDLVNSETPASREPAAPGSLAVWGPNVPLIFQKGGDQADKGMIKAPDVVNGTAAQGIISS